MKEKKTARMRDGYFNRILYTVYYYDGWYAVRGGKVGHYCGDSTYIHDGGNLYDVPSTDIFTCGANSINSMKDLIGYVKS